MPQHTRFIDPSEQQPPSRSEVASRQAPAGGRTVADRVRGLIAAVNLRLFTASATIYIAAGSFVGFEGLAFLLGFAPLWPIAIPIVIAGVAVAGLVVRRVRRRRADSATTNNP
ncbi:hypothetical protein MUN74_05175 [Agromyces endophyticus]|uniref:hypothetical protein n=1 Tax=Agromyces sp. H17E-10 TaxID=2932244 RepID=UPI001FD2A005|nr:hypothetical protein [Agromyces sp. H17E-10]UOQ90315.1 hypothetical protein MUN74_05175 [Agromyces sp. H17E-10]